MLSSWTKRKWIAGGSRKCQSVGVSRMMLFYICAVSVALLPSKTDAQERNLREFSSAEKAELKRETVLAIKRLGEATKTEYDVDPSVALAAEALYTLYSIRELYFAPGYYWDGTNLGTLNTYAGSVGDARNLNYRQDPKGIHCSGVTFSFALTAMSNLNSEGRYSTASKAAKAWRGRSWRRLLDKKHIRSFQGDWYGATDKRSERTVVYAMENAGFGKQVHFLKDARPGDFVQFWRTNDSGHSAIILDVIKKNDKAVGIKYFSAQKSTDGLGIRTEYFSDNPDDSGTPSGKVLRKRTYVGRLGL